jgi:hypothetical protein
MATSSSVNHEEVDVDGASTEDALVLLVEKSAPAA